MKLAAGALNKEGLQSAVAAYTEAIRADPDYAQPYAGRSLAFADFARASVMAPDVSDYLNKEPLDVHARALDWLETAMRNRDPFFDPLRNEPRFRAIERALKFPD